jgi:hypothetical protein
MTNDRVLDFDLATGATSLHSVFENLSAGTSPTMTTRAHMFHAMKEKRFAKRIAKRLLKSHSAVRAGNSDLTGMALYREVLVHSKQMGSPDVEQFLQQAADSVDLWTTSATQELGFRQIVHFLVMSKYKSAGHVGAVVSFREIVYSLIPSDL